MKPNKVFIQQLRDTVRYAKVRLGWAKGWVRFREKELLRAEKRLQKELRKK